VVAEGKNMYKDPPISPNTLERKSSFGSEMSCFKKPVLGQSRSIQHSTIINNFFINNTF
jgi:hypothetical protein